METFTRAGLTFDVRDGGRPDAECFVLLHGFPETSMSWARVAEQLHREGYRTLAPDQRGYSPRARPEGVAPYRIEELAADVVALVDQSGGERVHLVGHDWGGIVAWYLGAHHPEAFRTLTVLSTPHPRGYINALLRSGQLLRSWYALTWQLPALPERVMLARDGARLRSALVRSGLDPAAAGQYVDPLREPAALTAALNWYRAVRLSWRAYRSLPAVELPTLYVWSTSDAALGE